MKNPERVAELLAELRGLTETDFERHRIDVLEKDLTAPPVVEVIDEIHQKFDGVVYTTRDSNHYAKSRQLHRVIFAYYYGEIPDGYVIHHIDHNKANNNISNLQCLTKSEHQTLHNNNAPTQHFTCKYCGKIIPFSKIGKKIFCSQKCHSAWYRENAQVLEERQCEYCGKTFTALPWQDRRYCSSSCSAKARWQKERAVKSLAICPTCGKSFKKKHTAQQFCSRQCSGVVHKRKNKT